MSAWGRSWIGTSALSLLGCGSTTGPLAEDADSTGGSGSAESGGHDTGGASSSGGTGGADQGSSSSGGGGSSAAGGNGGGTGGVSASLPGPVDRTPYFPQDSCALENPCVVGECAADTDPCTPESVGLEVERDEVGGGNEWVVIDSAEDLESIQHCTSFDGTLVFTGPQLTSLEGLHLVTIDGDLKISASALESLAGLESLVSISEYLLLQDAPVVDLTGLSGLRYVGWKSQIYDLPRLESLNGLDEAVRMGNLSVANNPEFHDLSAISKSCFDSLMLANLPRLSSVEAWPIQADMVSVRLLSLPALTSLAGLEPLRRVNDMYLRDLSALEDASALGELVSVQDLKIENVPQMVDFETFESLEYIGRVLSLEGTGPTSLQGLRRLLFLERLELGELHVGITDYSGVDSLRELTMLNTADGVGLEGLGNVEYIASFYADSSISWAPLEKLERVHSLSLGGPSPLPTLPPSLTAIERLSIFETTSPNLAAFDSIANIQGLTIGSTDQLQSLQGFHPDENFDEGLRIHACADLDLSALSAVRSMSTLSITDTPISTLAAFEDLESLGGLQLENTGLVDVDALSKITTMGYLSIRDNQQLGSVLGLSQLVSFGEEFREPQFAIENNPMLPQCQVDELYERFGFAFGDLGNDETAACE